MAKKKAAADQPELAPAAAQPDDAPPPANSAKVTKPFPGVPDGKLDAIDYVEGDIIEGDLARAMIDGGYAEPIED